MFFHRHFYPSIEPIEKLKAIEFGSLWKNVHLFSHHFVVFMKKRLNFTAREEYN
jgi:hypothetical protein